MNLGPSNRRFGLPMRVGARADLRKGTQLRLQHTRVLNWYHDQLLPVFHCQDGLRMSVGEPGPVSRANGAWLAVDLF